MWPVIGGLISGGASLLGGMFSNDQSAKNTQAQIQAQTQMQHETMEWNERMSNTAYQRASSDMQKAGLNPAMMFSSGSAASSPQMSPQQVPVAQNRGALSGLGDAVDKVVSSAIQVKAFDKMTDEIALLRTQANLNRAHEHLTDTQQMTEKERTTHQGIQNVLSKLAVPGARVNAKQAKALEEMPDWLFKTLSQGAFTGGKASETMRPVSDLVSTATGLKRLGKQRSTIERSDSYGNSSFEERFHY